MLCLSHASFRHQFSERKELTASLEFTPSPDRITRSSGSFITDGFAVGMAVDVSGATNAANNIRRTITSRDALNIFMHTNATMVTEGPTAGVKLVAVHRDMDGLERWPYALKNSGGFSDGFGPSQAKTSLRVGILPVNISVNNQAFDAVNNVDEFDWYVSQRTDHAPSQWLDVKPTSLSGNSRSGTIHIGLTSVGAAELDVDISTPLYILGPEERLAAYKHVQLYVQRKSDKSWQWLDLETLVGTS